MHIYAHEEAYLQKKRIDVNIILFLNILKYSVKFNKNLYLIKLMLHYSRFIFYKGNNIS